MSPRFLVVGHVVQDVVPGGWRLGGTAAYAGLMAFRLGMEVAIVTSATCLPSELEGLDVHIVPSPLNTRFRNIYEGGTRRQVVESLARPISARHIPPKFKSAEVVLLGPVMGEVSPRLARLFPSSIVGGCLQGWLRRLGPGGEVGRRRPPQNLAPFKAVFLSDEDLDPWEGRTILHRWAAQVPIVAYTRGERGAEVAWNGHWRHIGAFPARVVDPTGAGDVFAAAFLVALYEGTDPFEAARFASAAASLVVEQEGVRGVPWRQAVEARLRAYPHVGCH